MQKKGLGRGLSALIPDAPAIGKEEATYFQVDVERITPSAMQPRRAFDEAKIEELAASVREQGVIQPLIVRPKADRYELIAGERRWRAAMKAGLAEVPVIIRDASDNEALQLALIENLQREDLNPMEEARAYRRLQDEFQWGQEQMSEKVGKSRPAVANSMRLLSLPEEIQKEVAAGKLPAGQARALLGLQSEAMIIAACREVLAKDLSTRETEKLVRHLKSGRKRRRESVLTDPNLRAVVEELQRALGTKVRLLPRARSAKGKIEIEYYSSSELDRIVNMLAPGRSRPG